MSNKLKLGLFLFFIGFLGVLTLLTVTLPLDTLPPEAIKGLSPVMIKLLVLANPAMLLILAVVVGTLLHDKVKLDTPLISRLLGIDSNNPITFLEQLKYGVLLGLLGGVAAVAIQAIFAPFIPQEFVEMGQKMQMTTLARFGYGGITEELLMRFGFMTLIVWLVFLFNKKLGDSTYWTGIILATLLFALGHLPVVFSAVAQPSVALLAYVIVGNSIVGVAFGWLYWKKGLESAFWAHICAHAAMLLSEHLKDLI